jgi:transposase
MIKSTKASLKFSNTIKLKQVDEFVDEYRSVVAIFVDKLWCLSDIPNLLPKELTTGIDTWLSARAIQAAGKQASGIVRGTKKKQEKRAWMIKSMMDKGEFKKARKLQKIYSEINISKPEIDKVNPELDSRFIKVDFPEGTTFDGWLTLSSLGKKLKIVLPFKKHDHFNKILTNGKIKNGIRLSKEQITFMFDLPEPTKKIEGKTIGLDIGQTTILSLSDGQKVEADIHGHTFQSICNKLAKKKRGSKSFERASTHRQNFIGWAVNQLNLDGIKQVNREDIKNMRRGRRTSNSLQHWIYAQLFVKLDSLIVDAGVQLSKKNPTYTSQRCYKCGWVRKGNRKKKLFECDKCGYTSDADLNASLNLSLPLFAINKQQRLKGINRDGFYWSLEGQEPIVPDTVKTNDVEKLQYFL